MTKKQLLILRNNLSLRIAIKKIQTIEQASQFVGRPLPSDISLDADAIVEFLKKPPRNDLLEQWLKPWPKLLDFPKTSLTEALLSCPSPGEKGYTAALRALPLPRNPKQTAVLLPEQDLTAREMYLMYVRGMDSQLLRMRTGDGKTFVYLQVARWLYDTGQLIDPLSYSVYKILIVTVGSVLEQTREVAMFNEDTAISQFGFTYQDIKFVTFDALRATAGEELLGYEKVVKDGDIEEVYTWHICNVPKFVIIDECQKEKNKGSSTAKILFNLQIPRELRRIFVLRSSATPFAKTISARNLVSSLGLEAYGRKITRHNVDNFLQQVASPDNPDDWSPNAMKRLCKIIKPYMRSCKIKPEFEADNRIVFMDFKTPEKAKFYAETEQRYLEEKAKLQEVPNASVLELVLLQKFQQAAELIRADEFAHKAHQYIQEGYAPIIACKFKPTIAKILEILVESYGYTRKQVSVIWGGMETPDEDLEISPQIIQQMMNDILQGKKIDSSLLKKMRKKVKLESSDINLSFLRDFDLLTQDRQQRDVERKRFQAGKSLMVFFTFGAGGAGISLHQHTLSIPPRRTLIPPVWNEVDMLQALGRGPRLTSKSRTIQEICVYKNTIEIPVLYRVAKKAGCLNIVNKTAQYSEELLNKFMEPVDTDDEESVAVENIFNVIENDNT